MLKQPNELWFVFLRLQQFSINLRIHDMGFKNISKKIRKNENCLSGIWIQFIHILVAPSFLECISNGVYKNTSRNESRPDKEIEWATSQQERDEEEKRDTLIQQLNEFKMKECVKLKIVCWLGYMRYVQCVYCMVLRPSYTSRANIQWKSKKMVFLFCTRKNILMKNSFFNFHLVLGSAGEEKMMYKHTFSVDNFLILSESKLCIALNKCETAEE